MFNGIFLGSFFLLVMIPSTFSLQFNFSSITTANNDGIEIAGDAYVSNQGIQVTPDDRGAGRGIAKKFGRATYVDPLHLWDKASGNLTDFITHFTFAMDSNSNFSYSDGLGFFMSPVNSSIPSGGKDGGLGLVGGNMTENKTKESFVAVELDTYSNTWDPPKTHVGINIKSMKSVATAIWLNNITLGTVNEAWISYNATSKNLTVVFTAFSSNRTRQDSLSYIVDLRDFLPQRVSFGFSAATGESFEKNNAKSWEFQSSLEAEHDQISDVVVAEEKKDNIRLEIGFSVGLFFLILGLALLLYVLWNWKRSKQRINDSPDLLMDEEFQKGITPKRFSYERLAIATNNFDEGEKLGKGGFGEVYKGFLREGNIYVAVKKVSKRSKQGLKEYASEVNIISQLRHRNLVHLIGWCHERGKLLLVYELMPNGSLDYYLFKESSAFPWETRYKIAKGLASALQYLHEECKYCIVHRDIKSSNVMLDSNFDARLSDFGLARHFDHKKGFKTTVLAGTTGYMAPEYVMTGRANKNTDVYSFGIVALEIACGRRAISKELAEGNEIRILLEWVSDLYRNGKLLDAVDSKLSSNFDVKEMETLLSVALWCAHPYSHLRPSIRQVIHVLNNQAEIPRNILPLQMPILMFFNPLNSLPLSISQSNGVQQSKNKDQLQISTCGAQAMLAPSASPTLIPPAASKKLGLPKKFAEVRKKTWHICCHTFGEEGIVLRSKKMNWKPRTVQKHK